tara:strand:+ start:1383 stop:1643 length:261 start_codon:yes stop_codon:yes gene_type:complete
MTTVLFSILFLIVGFVSGWVGAERYIAYLQHNEHDFEELFKENPHPELYNDKGEIDRGDYMMIQFDPGFNPENWDPETDIFLDEGE